jgi:hypothetical protein
MRIRSVFAAALAVSCKESPPAQTVMSPHDTEDAGATALPFASTLGTAASSSAPLVSAIDAGSASDGTPLPVFLGARTPAEGLTPQAGYVVQWNHEQHTLSFARGNSKGSVTPASPPAARDAAKGALVPIDTPLEALIVAELSAIGGYASSDGRPQVLRCSCAEQRYTGPQRPPPPPPTSWWNSVDKTEAGYVVVVHAPGAPTRTEGDLWKEQNMRATSLQIPAPAPASPTKSVPALVRVLVTPAGIVTFLGTHFYPTLFVAQEQCHPCGRRPEGFALLVNAVVSPDGEVDRVLRECAALEQASVPAFLRLALELESSGAPTSLVDRARKAARDEVRHACTMLRLLGKRGAVPAFERSAFTARRSLCEIAVENAREGCIRESFGALLAQVQQLKAADPRLREAFASVAEDETEHAQLAWDVHAWLVSHMTAAEVAEVECAIRVEIAQMSSSLPSASIAAGVPDKVTLTHLFNRFAEAALAA